MHDLPQKHSFGTEFFRFSDLKPLSTDDYFKCLNLLSSLFRHPGFIASTPGFYINRRTNVTEDSGNSVRLTYFTTSPNDSLKTIHDFVSNNKEIALFDSKESSRPEPNTSLPSVDDELMRFRNFLNSNTCICLEVLESFGEHALQELVTLYRYDSLPQRLPPEFIFGNVFSEHSASFRKLKETSRDVQYWRDLVHLHLGSNFGLHFMVNMIAVPESAYHPWFLREDWVLRAN